MDGMARSSRRSGSSVRGFFFFSVRNIIVIIRDHADVFDGAMIVLAMYTLNIFHPRIYLRGENHPSQMSSEGTSIEDKTTNQQGKAV